MNTIQVKRSSVAGKVPTLEQLGAGELAINTADSKMYFSTGTAIVQLSSSSALAVEYLNDLLDVEINTPVSGQSLVYDGTKWINFGVPGTDGGGAAKRIWSNSVAAQSGTTIITPGVTPPLVTEGTQLWTMTLTPFSTTARYTIQTSVAAAAATNNANMTLALFRGNTYLGSTVQIANSSNNSATLTINISDLPGVITPVTYQVRIGISSSTWYVNRRANEITYGGMNNGWIIWEY